MKGGGFARLSYPGLGNLGDAIQSLAASRFLPGASQHIDRETISQAQLAGPVKIILNGWFMHEPGFWPPHPSIQPLLISMHFVEPSRNPIRRLIKSPRKLMLKGAGAEFLRQWGPVGARDRVTLEALETAGIPAYHSGCLTLTLRAPQGVGRCDHIVACDLPPSALHKLKMLAAGREVISTSHAAGEDMSAQGQESAARALLQTYATASVVVTTRIHAALPCLAFGTPVLLLIEKRALRRITDMAMLVHSCSVRDFVEGDCDYDILSPPTNPTDHLQLARDLVARCKDFTGHDDFD